MSEEKLVCNVDVCNRIIYVKKHKLCLSCYNKKQKKIKKQLGKCYSCGYSKIYHWGKCLKCYNKMTEYLFKKPSTYMTNNNLIDNNVNIKKIITYLLETAQLPKEKEEYIKIMNTLCCFDKLLKPIFEKKLNKQIEFLNKKLENTRICYKVYRRVRHIYNYHYELKSKIKKLENIIYSEKYILSKLKKI